MAATNGYSAVPKGELEYSPKRFEIKLPKQSQGTAVLIKRLPQRRESSDSLTP